MFGTNTPLVDKLATKPGRCPHGYASEQIPDLHSCEGEQPARRGHLDHIASTPDPTCSRCGRTPDDKAGLGSRGLCLTCELAP